MGDNLIYDEHFKEELWYIFGEGYDLNEFFDHHPGGKDALFLGKGRDCTNIVLTYHFRHVRDILSKIEHYKTNHRFDPYDEYESYSEEDALQKELKDLIKTRLRNGGKIRIKTGTFLIAMTSYILMWTSIYYLLQGNIWAAIAAPVFGWLPACIFSHDGAHFAVFSNNKINRVMSWGCCPLFFNSVCWVLQHVISHHQFTNDVRRDVDMHHGKGFARISPVLPLEKHMPYTVRVFVFGIQMVFSTWAETVLYPIQLLTDYFTNTNNSFEIIPNKSLILRRFLPELVIQFTLSLTILVRPFLSQEHSLLGKYALAFVPFHISSVIFILMTQWAHLSEQPQQKSVELDSENRQKSFAENQILRSMDIKPSSPLLNLITGGLNCQSLHHMLPKVHNSRYIDLYPEYLEIAKRHGITPNQESSIAKGYLSYANHTILLNSSSNEDEEATPLLSSQ